MYSKYFLPVIMAWAGAIGASAAILTGSVADSTGEPLPEASIRLLSARDSSYVTGMAADDSGRFMFSGVKKGGYILQASYIGYGSVYRNLRVTSAADTVKVGRMQLSESSVVLREATAIGVATPIKVMDDTIQYSASTYKTPPNAVVEDLLKRLPGVEVGTDGGITAQGQKVTKILVDGKEFFSDDPAVASKNLPVNMVENAQVITRKSDRARLTGVDDGVDETVINLTVKKGMKNGWFGTGEAGYGTDDRYKAAFVVNRFFNDNQFTLLGNFNNCNDAGFSDGNGSRFRRFGGTNGINTTNSVGFNFNVGRGDTIKVGGNVMYANSDRDNRSRTHRINLLQGSSNSTEDAESNSRDKGHNVRGDFRVIWKPDSFNTLEVRPNFSVNINDSEQRSYSQNFSGDDFISQARNINFSDGKSYDFGARVIYSHRFSKRRGRSFSVSANYSMSNTRENERNWSRNAFWMLDSLYEDYQIIDNHTWNNTVSGRLSWTEPIGNPRSGNFAEISYFMQYKWNNADKNVTHDPVSMDEIPYQDWKEAIWQDWEMSNRLSGLGDLQYDPYNSNSFRNNYLSQSIRVGYRKVHAKYNLNAGLSLNPSMSRSVNLTNPDKNIPTRNVLNYAPYLRFRYKFSKNTTANADYFGRSSQPSMSQLQPVVDTSDPMNIVVGNPGLAPSFNHRLRLRFQTFDPDCQQSIMVMGHASYTQDDIVSNVVYDRETGARQTRYANVDGNWEAALMNMFSRPLRNKAFTINNFLRLSYRNQVGYVDGLHNRSGNFSLSESFGIAFRPKDLELELRPRYTLSNITNAIQSGQNRTTHSYGGSLNATYYTPFGLVLATDLNYSANTGYSDGYDSDQWMWNASISYMFLRNKNATVALKGYDLLQQRKSIWRTETAQAITDSQYNTLTRYFMLTFTYKFTTFGGGGENNPSVDTDFMRRGPRGGGPGGHGGRRF